MPDNNSSTYKVKPGDSLWTIAKKNNISLAGLISANPQVKDPDTLHEGEVLNLPLADPLSPQQISLPCCVLLNRSGQSPPADAGGSALIRKLALLRPGRTAITIAAHGLPAPSDQGAFNSYEGIALIPGVITWRWQLYPTAEPFPTWAGTFTEITEGLTPQTVVQVRPVNTTTNTAGSPVLASTLAQCK